jgi:hypothetical protein
MIIKESSAKRSFRLPPWLKILPFVGLAAAALAVILQLGAQQKDTAPPLLFCDAERVEGDRFVNGGRYFANGQTQSDDYARSGQFSSKLAPGAATRYGLTFDWRDFQPGARYEATIWRRQFGAGVGHFVVSGDGPGAFYQSTTQPVNVNPEGWEELRLQFALPPGKVLDKINFHVYTDGPDSVYFDDFKLIQLSIADFAAFQPRKLHLRIGSDGMDQLRQKRREALQNGILETGENDWVQGQFREDGETPIPVEVRLKGDWLDHLRGDKWSFRIECKDGGSWNRLVTFSLHTPAARYFLHEWLLHKIWDREEVLATRYDFAELFLNDQSLGIYAYEEHFEKQLAEYRERREGPILKFSEAGFWAGIKRQLQHHGFIRPHSGHASMLWENADIEAFGEKALFQDALLREQFLTAYERLDRFQRGAATASELFDLDLLARYFAVADLLQGYHGIVWHNQRFYYNPLTDLLEPIGFDGFGEQAETAYTFLGEGALHPQGPLAETFFSYVFQDTAFAARYIHHLYRYADPDYLQNIQKDLEGEWNRRLAYLQEEFPEYQPSWRSFEEKAQYIRSLILPFDQYSLKAAAIDRRDGRLLLQLHNTHVLPLRVTGYGAAGTTPQVQLENPRLLPATTPRRLLTQLRTTGGRVNDWEKLKYLGQESRLLQGLPLYDTLTVPADAQFLFFQLPGLPEVFRLVIPKADLVDRNADWPELERPRTLEPHPAYEISGKNIYFNPGSHSIEREIFFPPGYTVHIGAGTELDLVKGARIVSQSAVKCNGAAELPVRFHSSDGDGQGLLLMNEERMSYFQHTVFEGMQAAKQDGWQLTGAISVYRSNITFRGCVFQDMQSEDALNLIRSNFQMHDCLFRRNASDGLDSDFCKGEITRTRFRQMVNDGLDLSGSILEISDCDFDECGDKGISIGEESDVTASNLRIQRSPIAVACKDLSTAYLRDIELVDCQQGFVAFQKKPEFGPGYLFVESHTAQDVKRLYNIAAGSSLQLGERLIK